MTISGRHKARRLALQGLCCLDVRGTAALEMVRGFLSDSREAGPTVDAANELLDGAMADRDQCDVLLGRHARHWDVGRLALVDRNILRLGAYELRQGRTPYKVVITEALRLAREDSTAESPPVINGVLDAAAKELLAEPDHNQ